MPHDSGIFGVFICLTSRRCPLSSYEVRFLVFPQKYVLAKLGGFFRNVIQGISLKSRPNPCQISSPASKHGNDAMVPRKSCQNI